MLDPTPTYADLLARTDSVPGTSWGVFGDDDEIGTANWLTADRVRRGAACVRRGAVFSLDLPIGAIKPPLARHRLPPTLITFQHDPNHRDDYLDGLYLQGSSHIDGLRHMRHPVHGFYNATPDDALAADPTRLGIHRWARRGLVGRGVLVDVAAYMGQIGEWDPLQPSAIGPSDLDATLSKQHCELEPGDVLLLRTGWLSAALEVNCKGGRVGASAGLEQSHDMLGWLWDHGVAMIATDNLAVEVQPVGSDSPFDVGSDRAESGMAGLMHPELISSLGFVLGELWWLDDLAADCASDGVYSVLLTCKPLDVAGAAGSPANALAMK